MQETKAYLELISERGKKGLPLARVYRQLFNPHLYLTAYGKIYRNVGAMTPGTTAETADGMSLKKIETIIEALRHERYQWKPARRTYIPKKHGKRRPLGMPTWSDKIVQEVMRMILNAYYDPQFSNYAHGFRPERGCHSALKQIFQTWTGTRWFIEGDISACFDTLDHELLLTTIGEKIQDGRFVNLIRKLLEAGYLEDWNYHQTHSGTPQGGIVSPLLANILLDKLDTYVETTLIPFYTRGKRRKANQAYNDLNWQARRERKRGHKEAAKALRKQFQTLPSSDPNDPEYRRLRYVRYADDFLLGFIGPKKEAEEIKQKIGAFLRDELKLELSKTKTLITHARSEAARFLGYEITTLHNDKKRYIHPITKVANRSINGGIGLRVPKDVLEAKLKRYMRNGKAIHRAERRNESDYTIISLFQSEYRGIVEYYRLAYNLPALARLKWITERSLVKTLAHKHQLSVPHIYRKYQRTVMRGTQSYKVLQATVEREGKEPLVATWGAIPLTWNIQATLKDERPHVILTGRTELEKRLLAQKCEKCGSTEHIEVHHIRALKDLKQYPGRRKPIWVQMMAARRRKTLVLCRTCHQDIHHGRPLRRQTSSSESES